MNIILKEDYPSLGYIGDLVAVKPGFARNFLLPRGIAVEASSRNGKLLNHKLDGIRAKRSKKKAEAEVFAKSIEAASVEFVLKAGQAGKSFGAITARDIEAALKKQDIEINKKQIRLLEPIKSSGTYSVEVKVHAEVVAHLPVKITTEAVAAAPKIDDGEEEGAKKAKKAPRGGKKGAKAKDGEELSSEAAAAPADAPAE